MPRIPYVYPAAGESEVGDRIRARRGEQGLLPIDGMLLNAPEVARGYNELVEIADMLRELLASLPRKSPPSPIPSTTINAAASRRDVFPPLLAAALDFCDASSIHVKVPQSVFDSLKEHLSAKEMVEVTAIVGVFHLISRFCVALDVAEVGEEDVPTIEV
ncbi:carboxymuconolactone decarboxylase [Mycena alexandri]|uniref:Carboxymuconolactone decarboxylase n=1 Tax=Mycena alexandri TaxID=1745969 RepID=A0AAD6WQD6_9AGAR|nr:carboxymuconolactone decarboxylase [Mycena alexandri]